MRSAMALVVVLGASLLGFAALTDGFRVLTSEGARRLAVARHPVPVPPALLRSGAALPDALAADGRVVLVDFIYTRCQSLCTALGADYQQLQREITARGLQDRVRLLSLSFDPARDTPPVLDAYLGALRANPQVWRADSIPRSGQLSAVLDAFGIEVIGDGRGDFAHNAAIHVVSADGRLRAIFDPGRWREALADALRRAP